MSKIKIVKKGSKIFFKVEGDSTEFFDLDNLIYNHPELKRDVTQNRIELERVLMQQRELNQAYDTV